MSIFDYVNFKMPCPTCKKEIDGFQSHDVGTYFETVEYWQCDNFYSPCDYCNTWIEFNLKKPREKIPIEDYEMKIELNDRHESQIMRNAEGKIWGFRGKKNE